MNNNKTADLHVKLSQYYKTNKCANYVRGKYT